MQKKNLLMLSGLLLSCQISCVTSYKDFDFPICVELDMNRAHCIYTISEKEFQWNDEEKFEGKTYWEARPTTLKLPISSYEKFKTSIIKICKRSEKCKDITNWERKINQIEALRNE